MRSLVAGIWRHVERAWLKRELVGIDVQGNQYFRVWSKDEAGEAVEKRICKPVNTDPSEYTPESMPPEWTSWLRRQRRDPPTEEEIARWAKLGCFVKREGHDEARAPKNRNNAARAVLQQRVARLQAEDTKRRLQVCMMIITRCPHHPHIAMPSPIVYHAHRQKHGVGISKLLPNQIWDAL